MLLSFNSVEMGSVMLPRGISVLVTSNIKAQWQLRVIRFSVHARTIVEYSFNFTYKI
jgi:hypothetical protein